VRLRAAGSVALMVSCGTDGDTELTAEQVRGLAKDLGGQAHR
jgi:hypothetical protein